MLLHSVIMKQFHCNEEMQPLMDRLKEMTNKFEAVTNATKEAANQELLDFVAVAFTKWRLYA